MAAAVVLKLLAGQTPVHCHGATAGGRPRHPLSLPASAQLQPLTSPRPWKRWRSSPRPRPC
jgi:hypothetical protein